MGRKEKVEQSRKSYVALLERTIIKAVERDKVVLDLQILNKEIYESLLHNYKVNADIFVSMIKDFYESKKLTLREKRLILKQNELAEKNVEIYLKESDLLSAKKEIKMTELMVVNGELNALLKSLNFVIGFYKEDLINFDLLVEKKKKYKRDKFVGNYSRDDFGKLTRLLFDDVLPKKCVVCGSIDKLHIHHKKYEYPIREEDLMRVCHSCHSKIHADLKRQKKLNSP